MTNEELNCKVYRKASEEQATFEGYVESLSPHEILVRSFDCTIRRDILFALEDLILSDKQCKVLLECPSLVTEIFNVYLKIDDSCMDTIRRCIRSFANSLIAKER